jgi:hypothetical protein
LPSPIALTRQQDYQVSFKKIFNGGANIESRSKQSPVNHKQIQLDEKSHLQLTKTDSRLPFKLPSPHYSKPSFSLPSPSLGTSAPLHKVDLSAPVAISMTPSVVPLPELAPSPRASQMMVTGPLPQPVLKPVQMPLSALTPIPHSQAYLQLDLAPVAAPMTESPFPMPLPASLSSATYEPPTPTSAVAPQIGSVFAFAPNVPYRASKSEPPEKTSVCHDFGDWKPYMVYLQTKIRKESIPLGEELLGHVVVVTFKLHPDGSMSDLHLQKSNAPTTLSDALLKVLERTAPFKPLPYFADGAVDIQFTFNFKSMKGKSESDL